MRLILFLSFLANLILAVISFALLPERVAIHFSLGGLADGWASRAASTALMLGVDTLLFLLFWFSPTLLRHTPMRWVNLPHRAYWLSPERREATVVRLSHRLWGFGTALFVFLLVVGLLTLQANLSNPVRLDESLFLIALGVFLVYVLGWTLRLWRDLRPPQ
ncbi:DUF1648 domain-containing protein [Thiorhodovibrio litoralis]|uniref:DUF1648 domain-containing protein n=1 Tax=Thiorhodovibrio litoralis TaxID=2952932 RepID=UPI002B256FC3|nr:DUF1648 domain-containing protein [Thiorhodovibrio litoralis]WPL13088.1 putative integral membrane protein [Thiorhodovibrio litoralis]